MLPATSVGVGFGVEDGNGLAEGLFDEQNDVINKKITIRN